MAVSRKYAGLPDLDPAPEIYETPDLTEDGSTEQTGTLRTESPSPSDNGAENENFSRARLNQEEARRRFEPAIVDTRDTNLSDTIGGDRKGYRIGHRHRRRRVQLDDKGDEFGDYGDLSDASDVEKESLASKLARLRREAEELKLELARRENAQDDDDAGEFQDTVEHQYRNNNKNELQDGDHGLASGVDELTKVLASLQTTSRTSRGETLEQEFKRQLAAAENPTAQSTAQKDASPTNGAGSANQSTSISAIAAFSDRLTALEAALGLPAITASTNPTLILPTLDTLNNQITALHDTIATPHATMSNAQKDHIDILTSRLHTLHVDADSLLSTRKTAIQALAQLQETRHRGTNNSAVFARYLTRREARHRDSLDTGISAEEAIIGGDDENNNNNNNTNNRRASHNSTNKQQQRKSNTHQQPHHHDSSSGGPEEKLYTEIFLEEQSNKITALYNTLPTIQSLQPLLPVVLERLRALSLVHSSASSARNDMDEIEGRLRDWEAEIKKWKDAVEGVEKGIVESKEVMRENVDLLGGMVRGVEERVKKVSKG